MMTVIEYARKIEYKRRENHYMVKINGMILWINGEKRYVLLCQEENKELNGVHLQLQLGLGKRTGLNSLLVRVRKL